MEMEVTVKNLITALEEATEMAKQFTSSTTDSANIYASLHTAHRHLSLFLANSTKSQPQTQSSADKIDNNDDDDDDDDDPMRIADEEVDGAKEEEDAKMITIETMEERMKDFSIHHNKRLKRSLSSMTSLRRPDCEFESARARFDYNPHVVRLRALDLIYQFHC